MASDLFLYNAFLLVFLIVWAVLYSLRPLIRRSHVLFAPALTRAMVRWGVISRFSDRFKAYGPIAAILLGGAVLTAFAGDQFLDLAELVHARSAVLQTADTRITQWAIAHRSADFTDFFVVMTTIGGPAGVIVIAAIVSAVLFVKRRFRWLLYLAVTAGGGGLLNMELKRYFARARPEIAEMLRRANGYSFPSGHAMGSTVVFGALSYIAFRAFPQWRWKTAALAFAITLILAVAVSRVYLGVHWISDVAAGVACGAIWVGVTTMAYETLRRVRRLRAQRLVSRSSMRDARGA